MHLLIENILHFSWRPLLLRFYNLRRMKARLIQEEIVVDGFVLYQNDYGNSESSVLGNVWVIDLN